MLALTLVFRPQPHDRQGQSRRARSPPKIIPKRNITRSVFRDDAASDHRGSQPLKNLGTDQVRPHPGGAEETTPPPSGAGEGEWRRTSSCRRI